MTQEETQIQCPCWKHEAEIIDCDGMTDKVRCKNCGKVRITFCPGRDTATRRLGLVGVWAFIILGVVCATLNRC